MLPIVNPSLVNARTSSADWKLPVIATVGGVREIPLTSRGREEAEAAALALSVVALDRVFCSGLPRPRIWGQGRYWFWFRARRGDWSLCGRLSIRRELWGVLGRPFDPLGTRVLFGMLLGALNMGLHREW